MDGRNVRLPPGRRAFFLIFFVSVVSSAGEGIPKKNIVLQADDIG